MRAPLSRLAAPLLLAGLLACRCGGSTPEPDAGEADAGTPPVDAGRHDAGAPDSGVDAGPPPVLRLTAVLPPRGTVAGGTQVLVTGSAFIRDFADRGTAAKAKTTLKFGSNPAIDFQIIDDETIEVRTPPGKLGSASVSLVNPNGTFICGGCFTYYEDLYLTGISPKDGPLSGGNQVTLTGQGFTSDVEVLFGGRSSPTVSWVSSTELRIVVPGGAAADAVDVAVYNKNGQGSLRRGYRYLADLRVSALAPLTGPLAGGTAVTLTGSGLLGATDVQFAGRSAQSLTAVSDTQLVAVTPAGAALGAVDVTVVTLRETWTAKGAFAYADASAGFALYGVFPHLGPAAGGNTVTLLGQGLDAAGLAVTVGGQAAPVVLSTPTTAVVTVPSRGASARKVDVVATAASSATLADGYTYRLELLSVSPSSGPSSGGTVVTVSGSGLPPWVQVLFGALAGTVQSGGTESALSAVTPTGSGGAASRVRVSETGDPENEATLADAFTFEEDLAIARVQPVRGAIAGGSLVTVLGAGFGAGTVVSFGQSKAKDLKVVDSHTLTCRTPKGDVGSVDVKVDRGPAHDVLSGGYSYFDPRSISGGVSGGPLTGTLNVTVLDSTQGFFGQPVPLAQVVLGSDPGTPFQGLTDARGQLTFSDPTLVKSLTLTAFKEGYESVTVTQVASENLTVFMSRTKWDGDPSPSTTTILPSLISGRVTGFKQPRPLAANELLEARVFVSQMSLYGGPPYRGAPYKANDTWIIRKDGGDYLVMTIAGLRAVYAVFGVLDTTTQEFTPYLLGVRRGITTSPDNPATGQDIILDQHLDLTVPVTIDSPLNLPMADGGAEPAVNSVYAFLDLGVEGFIPNPYNWNTGASGSSSVTGPSATFSFGGFPHLDGSNFVFLNEAAGPSAYPVSYYFRRQPGDLSQGITIGPMLPPPQLVEPAADGGFQGTISWASAPGPSPDIQLVLLQKPTFLGTLNLWTLVLPGTESQVTLPPQALQKLRDEEAGSSVYLVIETSRSPKFNYNQWTYDTLSTVSWSSYTVSLGETFTITP